MVLYFSKMINRKKNRLFPPEKFDDSFIKYINKEA